MDKNLRLCLEGDCEFNGGGGTLYSLEIGDISIKGDGKFLFSRCHLDSFINCTSAVPPRIDTPVFEDAQTYNSAVLVVPDGAKSSYRANAEWGKFKNILELSELAAIDVLQPDTEGCTMTGVDGGIKVSATGSHMVTVHDIHGRIIRQVLVADGSQLIELPAGFYIVTTDGTAAQKLLVR